MQTAYVINKGREGVLDVCGPTVEFLNSPEETDAVYCTMIGTIPPGVSVPLHSHPDVESFFTLSGTVQVLFQKPDHFEWLDVKSRDFAYIPGGAKHAFRNTSSDPGSPLVLPNAWDDASAKAVVAAGFPVVAITSGGVAAALGYEDHERAPAVLSALFTFTLFFVLSFWPGIGAIRLLLTALIWCATFAYFTGLLLKHIELSSMPLTRVLFESAKDKVASVEGKVIFDLDRYLLLHVETRRPFREEERPKEYYNWPHSVVAIPHEKIKSIETPPLAFQTSSKPLKLAD